MRKACLCLCHRHLCLIVGTCCVAREHRRKAFVPLTFGCSRSQPSHHAQCLMMIAAVVLLQPLHSWFRFLAAPCASLLNAGTSKGTYVLLLFSSRTFLECFSVEHEPDGCIQVSRCALIYPLIGYTRGLIRVLRYRPAAKSQVRFTMGWPFLQGGSRCQSTKALSVLGSSSL